MATLFYLQIPVSKCGLQQGEVRRGFQQRTRNKCFTTCTKPGAAPENVNAETAEDEWDVSRSCVTPVFRRSICEEPEMKENIYVVFASEGNVCRSVFAEAIFKNLIEKAGLANIVECASKATKDYNLGESPDPQAVQVAEEHGLTLPDGAVSKLFDNPKDIVEADLVLVMDKFNAADVLKQIVLHEVVDKRTKYSHKVRRLGDFCRTRLVEDIDDPLYGNMGDSEETEVVRRAYKDIEDSCQGLVQYLQEVKQNLQGPTTMKEGVSKLVKELGTIDWLVPPMLQRSAYTT